VDVSNRSLKLMTAAVAAGAVVATVSPRGLSAQKPASSLIRVTESAGIRRNEYPIRATLSLPQGALDSASHARLKLGEADVTAQYTAASAWSDGSVRSLEVDFNASFNPSETREYRVEYGPAITSTAPAGRGLSAVEADDTIQVGSLRFGKRGAPLLLSANYRNEFIGKGSNGIAVVDANGARHDLSTSTDLKVDIRKRGPLMVAIQYSGTLPIYATPFTLLLEMPNSKAWLKWTFEVTDSAKRVRALEISTPFAFGAFPWLWDVGTQNDSYGAFRSAMDAVLFTQVIDPQSKGATGWNIETRVQGQMRPYETSSTPSRAGADRPPPQVAHVHVRPDGQRHHATTGAVSALCQHACSDWRGDQSGVDGQSADCGGQVSRGAVRSWLERRDTFLRRLLEAERNLQQPRLAARHAGERDADRLRFQREASRQVGRIAGRRHRKWDGDARIAGFGRDR
jgi:hypothetical protein